MKYLLIIGLIAACNVSISQKQANHWFFGYPGQGVRLDFNTSPPDVAFLDFNVLHSSASISDTAGNLLLYSDGSSIFGPTGAKLPISLSGNSSARQCLLFAKMPDNPGFYYLFHPRTEGTPALMYTIIDSNIGYAVKKMSWRL